MGFGRCSRIQPLMISLTTVVITILLFNCSAYSQSFQVGRISVCTNKIRTKSDACAELKPPFEGLNRSSFPSARIGFKLVVFGQQEALDYLNQYSHLPVKVAVWRDGLRKEDDIPIGISQSDWDDHSEQLANETSEEGQFRWRTFFNVNLNGATSGRIEVYDASGVVVLSDGRPASISFSFRN